MVLHRDVIDRCPAQSAAWPVVVAHPVFADADKAEDMSALENVWLSENEIADWALAKGRFRFMFFFHSYNNFDY